MRAAFVAVAVFVALVAAPPAGAATAEPQPTVLVAGFVLPATNGYKAFVLAGGKKGGPGTLSLEVHSRTADVDYLVPAQITETTIESSLGGLGEIDVHAVPSGRHVTGSSNCGGGGKKFTRETGRWEGTIRFEGEEGFTSIEATRAAASVAPLTRIVCGEPDSDEESGERVPGALLTVRRRRGPEHLEVTVRKNKRLGPTRLHAELDERRGKILIGRTINAVAPSDAFDFEFPSGHATVAPPAPFSGSLGFTRHGKSPSLKGNLAIDFPGRAAVPVLRGGKVSASIVRAVLNPSHPF